MGQSGHTSDLEGNFTGALVAGRPRDALENERGRPLQARQDGGSGIEQRPVPEIAMGTGDDRRPWRLGGGEDPDQPATFPELPIKRLRHDFGRPVKDDHVVGRAGGIALGRSQRS